MEELLSGLIGPVTGIVNKVTPRGDNGRLLAHSISAIGKHAYVSVVVKIPYGISLINSSISFPNTSISFFGAIIPTCSQLQFRTMWLLPINQSSVMFCLCSQRLNFARRKYLGSYLPSDTVLTVPHRYALRGFFILRPFDQKENHRR
jgi:hypothetical protein